MTISKTLMGAASALVLGLAAPAFAEIKVALDSPASMDSGTYVWAHTFTEYLNANGMEAVEYERGALGGEAEKLDQVSQGLLEVSMSDVKSAGTLDGTIFGVFLPYFFEDYHQIDKAMTKGGMLERINAGTTPKGVRVANVVYLGDAAGIFTTNKSVKSMADMEGLRMRALDEAQIEIFKAWGAQGTIVSWAEVPNALQTGVADGYLNPSFVPLLFGHTGFIKHFTDAQIVPSSRAAVMSEDWYQGLSDAERDTVNAAIEAANTANREWLKNQASVLDKLEEAGVEVIKLDDAKRGEFREASQAIWGNIPMPDGALDAWKAAIKD
ncbi:MULTISPECIES: TRAP transporter substrate-binding protein [Sulfitobacter]|uniref:TRAP transporter substrate-binding protein n=1 Tax=Sulfitobacter TaxID=60136 RepID=UPI001E44C938|nr:MULTISPECIES: TRAP transporter substrate-binding protein [Sulfitobacter]MCD2360983.1 TRAP transporter substrate-binding protein [Sulfitobacter mediterraneus]